MKYLTLQVVVHCIMLLTMIKRSDKGFAFGFWVLLGLILLIGVVFLLLIIAIGMTYEPVTAIMVFIFGLPIFLCPAHFMLFVLSLNKMIDGLCAKWWILSGSAIIFAISLFFAGVMSRYAAAMFFVLAFFAILIPQVILLIYGIKQSENLGYTKKMLLRTFSIPIAGPIFILCKRKENKNDA